MIDPAAMGTLLIGLNANQHETSSRRVPRPATAPRRGRSIRAALASGLRRAADQLQPQAAGELAR